MKGNPIHSERTAGVPRWRYHPGPCRLRIIFLILAILWLPHVPVNGQSDKETLKARQIKAALIYNFVNFVEWPKESSDPKKKVIRVGVIGQNAADITRKAIHGKKIDSTVIEVIEFSYNDLIQGLKVKDPEHEKIKALQSLHVIYFTGTEKLNLKGALSELKHYSILTIGQQDRFLESGGMINFVYDGAKIKFEINLDHAEAAKLKIRSKLLKLAKRVIYKGKES